MIKKTLGNLQNTNNKATSHPVLLQVPGGGKGLASPFYKPECKHVSQGHICTQLVGKPGPSLNQWVRRKDQTLAISMMKSSLLERAHPTEGQAILGKEMGSLALPPLGLR